MISLFGSIVLPANAITLPCGLVIGKIGREVICRETGRHGRRADNRIRAGDNPFPQFGGDGDGLQDGEVLGAFGPLDGRDLARLGEVLQFELTVESCQVAAIVDDTHGEGGVGELHPVGVCPDSVQARSQQAVAPEQAKAIVAVAAYPFGICPGGAIGGHQGKAVIEDKFHQAGVAVPAGDDAYATLVGAAAGIFQGSGGEGRGHGQYKGGGEQCSCHIGLVSG